MSQEPQFVSIGDQQLHYLEWGSGKRLLLAFHGYGNDARIFSPFCQYLEGAYTILSFDLPHHGASNWPEDTLLKKESLLSAVATLMKKYNVSKVSLLGYSLGGRVCMSIVERIPASIATVGLIASDGLVVNRLYYFCTRTRIGKKIFRAMLSHPDRYIRLLDFLKKYHLLDPSRHKFVMQHLQSAERRRFLLQVWPGTSDLIPDPSKLKRAIKQYHIQVLIFMGVHDRIMPPKLGEKFKQGLDTVHVFTFDKGHRVFDDTNAQEIAKHLL